MHNLNKLGLRTDPVRKNKQERAANTCFKWTQYWFGSVNRKTKQKALPF